MYNISDNSEGICFYLKYIHILCQCGKYVVLFTKGLIQEVKATLTRYGTTMQGNINFS